jgi:hypothetical protein
MTGQVATAAAKSKNFNHGWTLINTDKKQKRPQINYTDFHRKIP